MYKNYMDELMHSKKPKEDFDTALAKFVSLREQLVVLVKEGCTREQTDEKINEFASGLGFNIYCEEYIMAMADYALNLIDKNREDEFVSNCLQTIAIIFSEYAYTHSSCISELFKQMSIHLIKSLQVWQVICNGKDR